MSTVLKETTSVPAETENPLLEKFERSMATIWNTPEMQPLPKSSHLPKILDRLQRMCRDGIPEPRIAPDEGELRVTWEEGDKIFHLNIDVVALSVYITVGDTATMEATGTERWLENSGDWKTVEQELRDALGYQRVC